MPVSLLAQDVPLRSSYGLWNPQVEEFVRVSSARVILADYELIRRDFKETVELSDLQIDQWLLAETAYISKPQARQTLANTPISTTAETRSIFRPFEYRRGAVFATKEGLLDAKGTGSVAPTAGGHDNGLATLGEMIREYVYEKLVSHIFKVAHSRFSTVGSYAVVDYGFNVVHPDGSQSRAGYVLRQGHDRRWEGAGFAHSLNKNAATQLPMKMAIEIEALLRRFGITSAGGNRQLADFDRINIQGTKAGAVVDFGAFLVVDHFDREVYVRDEFAERLYPVWRPEDSPQPAKAFRVPLLQWGSTESGLQDPKFDNPYIWSHRLAESLARGEASRKDAFQHYLNLVGVADKSLANVLPTDFGSRSRPYCKNIWVK